MSDDLFGMTDYMAIERLVEERQSFEDRALQTCRDYELLSRRGQELECAQNEALKLCKEYEASMRYARDLPTVLEPSINSIVADEARMREMMRPPAGMFLTAQELAAHRDHAAISAAEMYLSPIARDIARMHDDALVRANMMEEIEQRQLLKDAECEKLLSTPNRFTDTYSIADVMPLMRMPRAEEPSEEAEEIEPEEPLRKPIGFHTEWLD